MIYAYAYDIPFGYEILFVFLAIGEIYKKYEGTDIISYCYKGAIYHVARAVYHAAKPYIIKFFRGRVGATVAPWQARNSHHVKALLRQGFYNDIRSLPERMIYLRYDISLRI